MIVAAVLLLFSLPFLLTQHPDLDYDPDYVNRGLVRPVNTSHTIACSADNKALFHKTVRGVDAIKTAWELYVSGGGHLIKCVFTKRREKSLKTCRGVGIGGMNY